MAEKETPKNPSSKDAFERIAADILQEPFAASTHPQGLGAHKGLRRQKVRMRCKCGVEWTSTVNVESSIQNVLLVNCTKCDQERVKLDRNELSPDFMQAAAKANYRARPLSQRSAHSLVECERTLKALGRFIVVAGGLIFIAVGFLIFANGLLKEFSKSDFEREQEFQKLRAERLESEMETQRAKEYQRNLDKIRAMTIDAEKHPELYK